jgi:ApbE superfamily uncharacterized protein (UPF0280 family)
MRSTAAWARFSGDRDSAVAEKPVDQRAAYQERKYRNLLLDRRLTSFQVQVKETDLYLRANRDLSESARQSVLRHRYQIERYLLDHPHFLRSLIPVPPDEFAPPVIRLMIGAGQAAGVGPMAAVAGAMAEAVGKDLQEESPEVMVENGGDIFLVCSRETRVGIFAGDSPLSLRVGLVVPAAGHPWGVCTSSGTVGPSLSFGRADAVCILAPSASLADAAATAVGNVVRTAGDLDKALEKAGRIAGVSGAVIILGEKLAAWGQIELAEIKE